SKDERGASPSAVPPSFPILAFRGRSGRSFALFRAHQCGSTGAGCRPPVRTAGSGATFSACGRGALPADDAPSLATRVALTLPLRSRDPVVGGCYHFSGSVPRPRGVPGGSAGRGAAGGG